MAEGHRILITGGAGFLGSALVEQHLNRGSDVVVVDNLSTGSASNLDLDRVELVTLEDDEIDWYAMGEFDEVYHFASPASPDVFVDQWDDIVFSNVVLMKMCTESVRAGGLLVVASSSEAYGQPDSAMSEDCLGSVRTQSTRGVYDESKRLIEAMAFSAAARDGVRSVVLRIFNTYGPNMPNDGRIVNTFVRQALAGETLTVHAPGTQTRSFCYVEDLIDQIMDLRDWSNDNDDHGCEVFNVGNDVEISVADVADVVSKLTDAPVETVNSGRDHDPMWRKPDMTKTWATIGHRSMAGIREGVRNCLS